MSDHIPSRGPERPRAEPEIIPPGRDDRARRGGAEFWMLGGDGIQRIYIARPGWPTIIFVLLFVGFFVAIAFLVLAGVVLFWIPILIGAILLALVTGTVRYRWRQLQNWWSGGR